MDNKSVALLNQQIGKEFYCGYLYLSISNYFHHVNPDGFGKWYYIQARDEADHGNKIVNYLLAREQIVKMDALEASKWDFKYFLERIAMSLEHEKYVTQLINELYALSRVVKDWRSCQFLDWYLAEQAEEQHNAHEMPDKYDLSGGDSEALFILDEFLSRREYEPIGKE